MADPEAQREYLALDELAGFGGWLADAGMVGVGVARPANPLDQIPEDVSVS